MNLFFCILNVAKGVGRRPNAGTGSWRQIFTVAVKAQFFFIKRIELNKRGVIYLSFSNTAASAFLPIKVARSPAVFKLL